MMRKVEVRYNEIEKTKLFVDKYWKTALLIAGAAGVVGAAVWMTARYLREKKQRDVLYDQALENVENEVESTSSEASVILNTGSYLGQISGDEGRQAIADLANSTENEDDKVAFQVLREVIDIEKKK